MKRFTFRFKKLQDLRRRDEEAALLRLALAQTDLAREEKMLAELVGAVADSGERLGAMLAAGAASEQLRNADSYRTAQHTAAGQQRQAAREAACRVAGRSEEFHQAHCQAEAIRKLHQRTREQHNKEMLRETQKELDEIGASRHGGAAAHFRHNAATGRGL